MTFEWPLKPHPQTKPLHLRQVWPIIDTRAQPRAMNGAFLNRLDLSA